MQKNLFCAFYILFLHLFPTGLIRSGVCKALKNSHKAFLLCLRS